MWFVLRTVFWMVVVTTVTAVAVLVLLLEDRPMVADFGAPVPEDVVRTREVVHQIRSATKARTMEERLVTVSEEDARSIAHVAGRLAPGLRGDVRIEGGSVHIAASLPVPWPGGQRWLNARAVAPGFEGRARLDTLEVGGVGLPPGPVIEIGRIGANLFLGNEAGDIFLESAERLEIADDSMRIALRLGEGERSDFAAGLFGRLRGSEMPSVERIDAYYVDIRDAMEAGTLAPSGNFVPYLTWTLSRVLEQSTDATLANEYTAAIFALARICGADAFDLIVGRLGRTPEADRERTVTCDEVLFADRIDTRRHFTTAAAIQAASNRGFAVAVGELKELNDSLLERSNGFDFTDLAANNAGIRLSNLVMTGTRADLRRTIAMIEAEDDLIPDLNRIPPLMSRSEFERRYGSLSSDAYRAQMDEIEAMIDGLTIHRPRS
jgi:hypothetical protein